MICYKDKTFCASKGPHTCGRELTKKDKENAIKLGLPISMSKFCEGERYVPHQTRH